MLLFKATLVLLFSVCTYNPMVLLEHNQLKKINYVLGEKNHRIVDENEANKLFFLTYVYDDGWSPSDPSGSYSLFNTIVIESGIAYITSNTTCATVTVNPGATLIIASGATLTATVNLQSTSQEYSSLISDGSISGTVNYNRYTALIGPVGTNDLISAPLQGQTFGLFATNNSNLAASGLVRAFAPFNTSSGNYENYNTVTNLLTTIVSGKGYRAATTNGSTLKFTGNVITGDVLDIPISDASAGGAWNLIGNPYPSYIDFATFFALNKTELNGGSHQAIYGYDGDSSDGWTIWNQAVIDSPIVTELIAPGQGFFVKAKSGGGLIDFTTAMRTSGSSDDFILGRSSESSPHFGYVRLKSSSNASNYFTDIYFNSNTSNSFDAGYDAAIYGGVPPSFSIYSKMVDGNSSDISLAVQAVNPDSIYNNMIPLGVNANQGEQLTISIDQTDIDESIDIYLDDTENNTSTLLTTNDFILTPNSNLSGSGRFYLRFSNASLGTAEIHLNQLNIYNNTSQKTIVISGVIQSNTKAKLYDLNGRLILSKDLNPKSNNQVIDVSDVSIGVFILQLENSGNEKVTKKIIIR